MLFIEYFIKAEHMKFEDPHNPTYSKWIAQAAARFHVLEMPLSKEPRWMFDTAESLLKKIPHLKFNNEEDTKRHQKVLSYNFEEELVQLKYEWS